jgi:transcription initiation factor TFIIIB Brf1 subunit/transcription initiation factor TFIIB
MKETKKIKKYRKGTLRKRLEKEMQEYWGDPTIKVTPMEFSRMLKTYCEEFGLSDEVRRAKELEEPLVDAFGSWLGYPLR